jgi:hypothetical protein
MVLGMVLYEAVDIFYNVSKIGINTVKGVYNWYYEIEDPVIALQKKESQKIEELEDKINKLSELLVNSNIRERMLLIKDKA